LVRELVYQQKSVLSSDFLILYKIIITFQKYNISFGTFFHLYLKIFLAFHCGLC